MVANPSAVWKSMHTKFTIYTDVNYFPSNEMDHMAMLHLN